MKTCASLFSGFGGWEVGAVAAGYTPLWAVELDPKIAQVHRDNFPDSQVINDSVTAVSDEQIGYLPRVDVLFASPPCQAYSVNRSKKLAPRDDGAIGLDVLRWVRIQQPGRVFVENVQGYRHSESFKGLVQGLRELGYTCAYQVFDAASFGVPQHRQRLILHATLGTRLTMAQPNATLRGWHGAIADLIPALPAATLYPRHAAQRPTTPGPLLANCNNTQRNSDGSRRTVWYGPDRPSYTISAAVHKAPPFYVNGPEVRRITTRAIARLCSFPDFYQLPDNKKIAYKGLGNAVPPLMAQRIVESANV